MALRSTRQFQGTNAGPFRRYVVVDIVSFTNIEHDVLLPISNLVDNNERFVQTVVDDEGADVKLLIAPRNSIIAKDITRVGANQSDAKPYVVLYPFFSSHMALPAKPGEHVWGMEEGEGTGRLFWLTRIHEPEYIEDPNYTHSDRIASPTSQNVVEYGGDTASIEDIMPGFPNGRSFKNLLSDRLPDNPTLKEVKEAKVEIKDFTLSTLKEYEDIITNTLQGSAIAFEPVPRLSKRPGDFAIQGSNNTTILLGTERGYGISTRPDNEQTNIIPENDEASSEGLKEGMGAIDIVVGRGRLPGGAEANADIDPVDTRPRVVKNSRDNFETNKNIGLDPEKAEEGSAMKDVAEGDPDMVHDAARIYMSMKSNPDSLFNLTFPNTAADATVDATPDNAAIIAKSDQIRIIARKDDENNINGSVRIIKEGTEDSDRATIVMQPDGTIMIDGPKIVIGSGIEGANGEGSQVFIGRDATESVVLGNELKTMLTTFLEAIGTEDPPVPPPGKYIGNMGGALITPIPAAADALKADLDKFLSKNAKTK